MCQSSAILLKVSENKVCFQCCPLIGGLFERARVPIMNMNTQLSKGNQLHTMYLKCHKTRHFGRLKRIQFSHTAGAQRCFIANTQYERAEMSIKNYSVLARTRK